MHPRVQRQPRLRLLLLLQKSHQRQHLYRAHPDQNHFHHPRIPLQRRKYLQLLQPQPRHQMPHLRQSQCLRVGSLVVAIAAQTLK